MPAKCLAGRSLQTLAGRLSLCLHSSSWTGGTRSTRAGLTKAVYHHSITSFTGRETKALRVHSLPAQERQNGGTEGLGEGQLICLTGLWPKVSCHIPASAGPLPSPKHGALWKEKEEGSKGAREASGGYRMDGQVVYRAEWVLSRETSAHLWVHRPSSCVMRPQACHSLQEPQFSHL